MMKTMVEHFQNILDNTPFFWMKEDVYKRQKLRDTRIKKVNHIWISKTTGRIRWEHGTDAEH